MRCVEDLMPDARDACFRAIYTQPAPFTFVRLLRGECRGGDMRAYAETLFKHVYDAAPPVCLRRKAAKRAHRL